MGMVLKKGSQQRLIKKPKNEIEVTLPTEKSVPVGEIGGYSILIFGRKKIGKTTLTRYFDENLYLMFEPGGKALRIFQRPVRSWPEFKAYVKLITKEKNRFKTITIDPIDIAYELCLKYVCDKLLISHPADAEWGKGWNAVKTEFMLEINKLLMSGKGIIFISHLKEEEVETRAGKKYKRITNSMAGQASEAIVGAVDVWAAYDYDGAERRLTILGDETIDAGHRLNEPEDTRFRFTNGKPIRVIPMGNTSKESYDNFIKAFNNQLIEEGGTKPNLGVKKTGVKLKLKK